MRAWVALALLGAVAAGDDPRRAALLSGEWIAANRALDELLAERAEVAVPLLTEALSLDESFLRRRAAQTLALFGKDAAPAVPALIQALYDEDPLVAVHAAAALDAAHAQEAVPHLQEAVRSRQVAPAAGFRNLRLEAPSVLERWTGQRYASDPRDLLRDPRMAKRLREGLAHEEPAVRAACAEALGAGGAADAVLLLHAAVEDASFEVCGRAALALGRLGASDPETVVLLAKAWQRKETFVRRNVATALGALGEAAFPAIAAALDGQDLRLRRWAAFGLAACPVPPAPLVPSLCGALDAGDRTLRLLALRALATAGASAGPAVPRLAALLGDADEEIVLAVLATLARVGPPAAPAAPRILVRAPEAVFRVAAIAALGAIRAPEAMDFLLECLEAGSGDAADALLAMGHADVIIAATVHAKVEARRAAAGALLRRRVETPEAVAALRRLAKDDPDAGVRAMAAHAVANAPTRDDDGLGEILARVGKLTPGADATWAADLLLRKAKPETLVALLEHPDDGVRRAAALACAKDQPLLPETRAAIVGLLDDPKVRDDVAPIVVGFRDASTVGPLLRVLAWQDRRRRPETLARQIASLGEAAVAPATAALGNADLRAAAAEVLGWIGPPAGPAVPGLAALLRDPDRRTAEAAVRALARIGSAPHVREALLSKTGWVRGAARMAVAEGSETLLADLRAAAEQDPALRRALTDALRVAKDVPALVALAKDPDAAVRAAAVQSLAEIDDPAARPALLEALRDAEPGIRFAALHGLTRHKGAGAEILPALEALLAGERDVEALNAAAWLARSLGEAARPMIERALVSKEKRLRLFAIDALAPDLLLAKPLAGDGDDEVRAAAARRLAGNREALDALVRALDDKSPKVRSAAARSLGDLGKDAAPAARKLVERVAAGDGDAIGVLKGIGPAAVPFLVDLPPKHRRAVEEILRGIGVRAAPPLVELLGAEEAEKRRKAAWALGLLGRDAEAAVPALTKALSDGGKHVAVQAAWALGEIGPAAKSAIPELENLLADPAKRSAAADALRKIKG